MKEPASQELWDPLRATYSPKEAESRFQETLEATRPAWNEMATAESETSPEVITLAQAQVLPLAGGDGIALAATRIPLDAVTTWWFGAGKRLKARTGTSWWFGIGVPLDG
jgi:hypothetical protein